MRRLVILFLLCFFLFPPLFYVRADELDDVTHKLEDLKKLFSDIKTATDTNQATLDSLNRQLNQIKAKVADL
ncbi:hypothetical protein HY612_02370 [Candidatus Roizmanbacteria bacterium]|nr:hypothetical protein [Candidatus Roizmanbacteria bacterium]